MSQLKNKYQLASLALILIFSISVWLIPIFNTEVGLISNGIPQFPDALAEIHGAEYVINHGEFHKGFGVHNVGYVPERFLNSPPSIYPLAQILFVNLYWVFGMETYNISINLTIILCLVLITCTYVLLRNLIQSSNYALIALPFIATSSAIGREIVWSTPHSLQGQIITILSLIAVWKFYETKKIKWMLLFLVFIVSLVFIHLYSVLILVMSLVLYSIYHFRNNIRFLSIILLLCGLFYTTTIYLLPYIIGGFAGKPFSIVEFPLEFLAQYTYPSLSPLTDPPSLLDYPSIWGYVYTIIGVHGLMKLNISNVDLKKLPLILFILPIAIAAASAIGLYFLVIKNIFVVWIALAIGFAFGIKSILSKLDNMGNRKHVKIVFISFLLITSVLTGINCIRMINSPQPDHIIYHSFSNINFIYPSEEHLIAFNWIKNNTDNSTILISIDSQHAFLRWAPILTLKNISFGSMIGPEPEVELELKKTFLGRNLILPNKEITSLKKKGMINSWTRYYNANMMLTKPDSDEALKLMNEYNIGYVYTWNNSQYNKNFIDSENFELYYEKDNVRFYKRII